jgi:hypothetical protein
VHQNPCRFASAKSAALATPNTKASELAHPTQITSVKLASP